MILGNAYTFGCGIRVPINKYSRFVCHWKDM